MQHPDSGDGLVGVAYPSGAIGVRRRVRVPLWKPLDMGVRTPDIVSTWIRVLHDTYGLSDRAISQKPYFSGIPPGTINAIRNHGYVPKKWRRKLRVTLEPPRPRIAINLLDPESAAATIIPRVDAAYRRRLAELLDY